MEEARDELAVRAALGVVLGSVVGSAVDGEHDPEPAAPGGEDHAVDRLAVDHAQLRLAGLPGDRDADGADAEVAGVDQRALGGRLVGPLEAVVGDTDQQAGARPSRSRECGGERQAGEQCPGRASHPLYIGAGRAEPETARG